MELLDGGLFLVHFDAQAEALYGLFHDSIEEKLENDVSVVSSDHLYCEDIFCDCKVLVVVTISTTLRFERVLFGGVYPLFCH